MSFRVELPQNFRQRLEDATGPLVGMWACAGSPTTAEILAASGSDWIMIDAEHSPVGLESTIDLLRAMAPYPATSVVRLPALDPVLIKQFLDLGAQNLVIPMIDNVEQAELAVASVNYPPHGIRGVGSALGRSSRWNLVNDYLNRAPEFISLTLQIESVEAVNNIVAISALEGVDSLFIGPSDLAASMGYLGQQNHPEVVKTISHCIKVAKDAGKKVGINAFDPVQARDYVNMGVDFILIAADVQLLAKASQQLLADFRSE
ncbi:HpcH/HpaI aldolase family protein [Neomicrococcus lactis]